MSFSPLRSRLNKLKIEEISVYPDSPAPALPKKMEQRLDAVADDVRTARKSGNPVVLAFGAHTIKNGMGPLLSAFIHRGWLTHLATNGAGVIHDWEFAYLGQSSEDVARNVSRGCFGTWEETGLCINLALAAGAYEGRGYGEAIGYMIHSEGLNIPSSEELEAVLIDRKQPLWKRGAAADYLELIREEKLPSRRLEILHPFARFSIQAAALRSGVPFTSHPMFGHDIIYTHRANRGAAVGRCAERDFLSFVASVAELDGGVYLSLGSAVMSPMIFEKSLSMARNVSLSHGADIRTCSIHVVDLQPESWDWSRGEPSVDNPAYYLRFMKTFSRMGCPVDYTSMDNRAFLLHLYKRLEALDV